MGGRIWFVQFFSKSMLDITIQQKCIVSKVFHDRLEFYLKPCFHKIAAIAKIEIKSAIVAVARMLKIS